MIKKKEYPEAAQEYFSLPRNKEYIEEQSKFFFVRVQFNFVQKTIKIVRYLEDDDSINKEVVDLTEEEPQEVFEVIYISDDDKEVVDISDDETNQDVQSYHFSDDESYFYSDQDDEDYSLSDDESHSGLFSD